MTSSTDHVAYPMGGPSPATGVGIGDSETRAREAGGN